MTEEKLKKELENRQIELNKNFIWTPEKVEKLRELGRKGLLYCPCGCGSNLILVAGDKNLRERHILRPLPRSVARWSWCRNEMRRKIGYYFHPEESHRNFVMSKADK